jgi:hypothetical protein
MEKWTEERKTEKSDAGGRHYGRKNEYRIENSELRIMQNPITLSPSPFPFQKGKGS